MPGENSADSGQVVSEEGTELDKKRLDILTGKLKEKNLLNRGCVFCGEKDMVILGYKDEYPVILLNPPTKYYEAYAMACSNCGFVHTFMGEIIEGNGNG